MIQVTYIIGPVGSGKTTLAEALSDYLKNKRCGFYQNVEIVDNLESLAFDWEKLIQMAASGKYDAIVVALSLYEVPKAWPVKPYRVIRIGME